MATWITHLMLADSVLEKMPQLDKRSFCVGNIAPDCNVENEDWTQFVPPREITHWMSENKKTEADCERFFKECIENRKYQTMSKQELSFLLGYYAHLVADAEFQRFMRDTERVAAAWMRIKKHPILSKKTADFPENWDSIKKLISKKERMKDIYVIEAEYLETHPKSGYISEITDLSTFPSYIDFLPQGAIVRKIAVMKYFPIKENGIYPFISVTREEYYSYIANTTQMIVQKIHNYI